VKAIFAKTSKSKIKPLSNSGEPQVFTPPDIHIFTLSQNHDSKLKLHCRTLTSLQTSSQNFSIVVEGCTLQKVCRLIGLSHRQSGKHPPQHLLLTRCSRVNLVSSFTQHTPRYKKQTRWHQAKLQSRVARQSEVLPTRVAQVVNNDISSHHASANSI
jgi:hypothetical protein